MIDYGYQPENAVVICVSVLQTETVMHRPEAIDLLERIVETNAAVDIDVEPFLRDKESIVRIDAAKIYWLKTHDAKRVIPILTKALDSTKNQTANHHIVAIERVALRVLGEMGPAASSGISAIERMERDPDPDTAKAASEALRKIRGVVSAEH
jgi:hypothetical protein